MIDDRSQAIISTGECLEILYNKYNQPGLDPTSGSLTHRLSRPFTSPSISIIIRTICLTIILQAAIARSLRELILGTSDMSPSPTTLACCARARHGHSVRRRRHNRIRIVGTLYIYNGDCIRRHTAAGLEIKLDE